MGTETRIMGQNVVDKSIKVLNILSNRGCLLEMKELAIEVVLLVMLKTTTNGRAQV